MEEVFSVIQNSLQQDGFAYISKLGRSQFDMINKRLGNLLYETDIKLDSSKSNVVYNPEEVLFHTDYPKAQIVSWICVDSNDSEAPIELIDTNNFDFFDPKILDLLRKVDVFFKCKLTSSQYKIPLIIDYGNRIGTTYNPWGIQQTEFQNELSYFYKYLEVCNQYTISLKENDALFIDNHRLLHGRKEISPNSKRHLIRRFLCMYPLQSLSRLED